MGTPREVDKPGSWVVLRTLPATIRRASTISDDAILHTVPEVKNTTGAAQTGSLPVDRRGALLNSSTAVKVPRCPQVNMIYAALIRSPDKRSQRRGRPIAELQLLRIVSILVRNARPMINGHVLCEQALTDRRPFRLMPRAALSR